ncbi:hypothetical protein ACFZA2_10310 [Microbacterium sp. NPDC007973]|uniref:hypothetical protein n=1 Tax=Microbacterium sp. NPDC007973 TaxID=3364182 RepID=UPI0036ECE6EA
MTLTFRLEANASGKGSLAGQLHSIGTDHVPAHVGHHLNASDVEKYHHEVPETGDTETDDEGHAVLRYVSTDVVDPKLEPSKEFGYPLVGPDTRVR